MLIVKTGTLSLVALTALLGLLVLTACGDAPAATQPAAPGGEVGPAAVVTTGDATRGETLFVSSGCVGCHATTDQQIVGPGLAGVFAGKGTYGDKLPNGKPINEANVIEWLRIGGVGKIGEMPGNITLADQELADITAYLKTLQ